MNRHAKLVTEEFNKRAINPGKSKKKMGMVPRARIGGECGDRGGAVTRTRGGDPGAAEG